MIRVLYHTNTLGLGGSERQLCRLAANLDRTRYDPIIWCDYSGPLAGMLEAAGVPVHCCLLATRPGRDFDEAVAWIRSVKPDVFQTPAARFDAMDAKAAAAAGVPAIITTRGNIRHWDPASKLYDWERERNALTHLVIANSNAVADITHRVEGVERSRLRVIYNGVPLPGVDTGHAGLREELGLPPGTPLVGTVGNLRHVKGHDVLLRAFLLVREAIPEACLAVAGANHEDEGELERLWRELNLESSVFFLDQRIDIENVYRSLDVYAHASRSEGLPNAVLEAMSFGVPVVATAVGGVPEIIEDGVSGLLAPPEDPPALAAGMIQLLRNPADIGAAGRERVRGRFGLRRMVEEFETLYSTGLTGIRKRPRP